MDSSVSTEDRILVDRDGERVRVADIEGADPPEEVSEREDDATVEPDEASTGPSEVAGDHGDTQAPIGSEAPAGSPQDEEER